MQDGILGDREDQNTTLGAGKASMTDEDRCLREESELRSRQHWPWFGAWPGIEIEKNVCSGLIGRIPIGNDWNEENRPGELPALSELRIRSQFICGRESLKPENIPNHVGYIRLSESLKRELPESPKIPMDYKWQPFPWDDGKPEQEAKAEWMADLSAIKFCSECDGFVRSDLHGSACEACGLVHAGMATVHGMGKKEIVERTKEVILDEIAKHANHGHIASVKQSLNSAKVDQRIEAIVLSSDCLEEVTDSFKTFYMIKIPKLLKRYNEGLDNSDLINYESITVDQARDAYERRFTDRKNRKIDNWIEKFLKAILSEPNDRIRKASLARVLAGNNDDLLTEKYFPWNYVYDGTERAWRECTAKEADLIREKALNYYRQEQVRKLQKTPNIPIQITRTYKVNNEIKKIIFTLAYGKIYLRGDEIGNGFRKFFLQEALKRKMIGDTSEDELKFEIDLYERNPLHTANFYDPTPYELQEKRKKYILCLSQ